MNPPIETVYIPSIKKENGFGHIKRLLSVERSGAFLIPDGEGCWTLDELRKKVPEIACQTIYKRYQDIPEDALVILDQREAHPLLINSLLKRTHRLMALDEGCSRRNIPYLADTLPSVRKISRPNIQLNPVSVKFNHIEGKKIKNNNYLVTFGGEDPASLTAPAVEFLISSGIKPENITAIQGPLFKESPELPQGVSLIKSPSSLREYMMLSSTVITSFGLTAYEAAASGCKVILINPSTYHEKLTQKADFSSLGTGKKALGKKTSALQLLTEQKTGIEKNDDKLNYDCFLREISPDSGICPACGGRNGRIIERFEDSVFWFCRCCRAEYLQNWRDNHMEYNKDYFFSQYSAQYGKSYLEDFEHIKEMAYERLEIISSLLPQAKDSPSLLDIGCAYGPFLSAAEERGYTVYGSDISSDAVEYVRNTLGIQAVCGSFPGQGPVIPGIDKFDTVTLWYVIEHFRELNSVLEKISGMVTPGGILSISTPYGRGISARKNRRHFLKKSPRDHFIIWRRSWARKRLSEYGFRVIRFRSTGHHPERFGALPEWMSPLLGFISRFLFLGDTFEIYAVRKEYEV